ncbi:Dihydrosphingosine 1-phosphate phosphatase [Colletotrichum tanaceti]|uniref:Dihydrosphingosine 1-phosphate phosphatase n=1 Tax=Colletotrichum tanaceti TaxID=1306861 RepID=A0A4V6DI20_9PEZI|nr:Dihydrosphingosine 1-phosphate phosphatase [Colletotrichum tanaceti]TKW58066.1 Dihydrosphingosine 1-phosphate phosphatase [Colletotrichum tanaceti]
MPHDRNIRQRLMTSHINGAAPAPKSDPERRDATVSNPTATDPVAIAEAPAPPLITIRSPSDAPDAGLRSLDHYKRALPSWRYRLRQWMLPLIRWETPYLAYLQDTMRTPWLDSYFAITANLGTHTFFMIGLPMLFWCGYASFGKGVIHILAEGVFFTGFIKDFFSLPRPLSPPLHRITMSGSAALEYGFPSTHSANAVSVAVYGVLLLRSPDNALPESTKNLLEGLSYFYAVSIVLGRLYCGMHGFIDVVVGSILGAAISLVEFHYGPPLDAYMHGSSWWAPVIAALIVIVLVRIHPEPADDCPCFDDSVAFAGVVIGLEIGTWMYGRTSIDSFGGSAHTVQSLDLGALGWHIVLARVFFGVFVIFVWREVMKPTMLRILPHLFRLLEKVEWNLPRRFFTPASKYKVIDLGSRMDNLIPSVRDFPRVVQSIRHPTTRGRSVSIGPQSAADAYETLAYRERRRRESIGSNGSIKSKGSLHELREKSGDWEGKGATSGIQGHHGNSLNDFERMMGTGSVLASPSEEKGEQELTVGQQDEISEKEMFLRLIRPRVRYDVEVVTKLVVYTGIAWLGVGLIPMMFELVGLGSNHLRAA